MDPPWSVRVAGRGAAVARGDHRGAAWFVPDGGEPVASEPATWRSSAAPSRTRSPTSRHAAAGGHPPRPALHDDVDGEELAQAMDLGVRTWGNEPRRRVDDARRHLRASTARSASGCSTPCRRVVVLRAGRAGTHRSSASSPRRSSRTSRARRLVLDRLLDLLVIAAAAGVVRPAGGTGAGVVPGARRPGRRAGRCACSTTTPSTRGRSPSWPPRSACHGPRWPAASPSSSASRRCRSSPAGAWRSPPTCCASRGPPSARSPARSATAARSPSARRSSGSTASAPASTALATA